MKLNNLNAFGCGLLLLFSMALDAGSWDVMVESNTEMPENSTGSLGDIEYIYVEQRGWLGGDDISSLIDDVLQKVGDRVSEDLNRYGMIHVKVHVDEHASLTDRFTAVHQADELQKMLFEYVSQLSKEKKIKHSLVMTSANMKLEKQLDSVYFEIILYPTWYVEI